MKMKQDTKLKLGFLLIGLTVGYLIYKNFNTKKVALKEVVAEEEVAIIEENTEKEPMYEMAV